MAISVKNLHFSYPGVPLFSGISFDIKDGDFVAIIGPNGAGKTTLANLLLGKLEPQKGTIHAKLGSVGYVPQRLNIDKNFPGTVREILSVSGEHEQVCSKLSLQSLLNKKFTQLSGGQQQRVLIALALQRKPKVLILDEPATGVDIAAQRDFYSVLKHLNDSHNYTILLISHDVGMVTSHAKTVLCINHGVCCMGHAKKAPQLLKKTYGDHFKVHHHH